MTAAAVVAPGLHELRRVGAAPGRPTIAALRLTARVRPMLILAALRCVSVFVATIRVRVLRARCVRVARGLAITRPLPRTGTMTVTAMFAATVALGMPAVALMRAIARTAMRTMLVASRLTPLADAEHGVAVRRDLSGLMLTPVVGVPG